MSEPATAELPPQTNGVAEPDDEEEKGKMRPADIDADMKEMEKRKRVEMIMTSRLFREELERIIESQMKEGGGPAGLLQQIRDMVGGASRLHAGAMFKNSSCVVPINDIRGVESMGYTKGEKVLRCKLAAVFRLMDLYGWTHGIHNHITARLNQEQEHFLVNPFGMMYHELTASSLVKVDMQGSVVEQGTTNFGVDAAKFQLHGAVHAARPDVKCVIHIHTPSVVAISSLKVGLLPLGRESAVLGEVSQHRFLGGVTEPEEKDKIARSLGPINKVLLLSNAGALCCGETVEEAFFNVYNTVLACETQVKLMPMGIDNLEILPDEARKAMYDAARKAPEGALPRNAAPLPPALEKKEKKWRIGGMEFEALMRMLDNAGFRTGYIYRTPLVKGEPPKPRNDVEVPPAVSSLGYLLEEEEMYKQGQWKKGVYSKNDRTRWLNSPNVYQKVEILETGTSDPKKITKWVDANNQEEWVADGSPTHTSTPVRIDAALQFVPKNTNPKEFKKLQQQIKENRRADKITSGPQSHILEGVTWEEAKKLQDATISMTGDHVIQIGAASKGIIQRGFQHNATVYKTPYAKNPFDCVSDQELEDYKKVVTRKNKGEYYDEDASESEALSSSAALPPSDIKSPPSETEDDSRTEPRVLRIETKTAPVASQAEVVLSDDSYEKSKPLKLKVKIFRDVGQVKRRPFKICPPSPIKEEEDEEADYNNMGGLGNKVIVENKRENCSKLSRNLSNKMTIINSGTQTLESTSSELFHSTQCFCHSIEKVDRSVQTKMRIWFDDSGDESSPGVQVEAPSRPNKFEKSFHQKEIDRRKSIMFKIHDELKIKFQTESVKPIPIDEVEEVSLTAYSRSFGDTRPTDYDQNCTGFSSDDTSNSCEWSSWDEDNVLDKEKESSLIDCVGDEYEGFEMMTDSTERDISDISPVLLSINKKKSAIDSANRRISALQEVGVERFVVISEEKSSSLSSSPYSSSPSDQAKLHRDMDYLRRKFALKASILQSVSSTSIRPLFDGNISSGDSLEPMSDDESLTNPDSTDDHVLKNIEHDDFKEEEENNLYDHECKPRMRIEDGIEKASDIDAIDSCTGQSVSPLMSDSKEKSALQTTESLTSTTGQLFVSEPVESSVFSDILDEQWSLRCLIASRSPVCHSEADEVNLKLESLDALKSDEQAQHIDINIKQSGNVNVELIKAVSTHSPIKRLTDLCSKAVFGKPFSLDTNENCKAIGLTQTVSNNLVIGGALIGSVVDVSSEPIAPNEFSDFDEEQPSTEQTCVMSHSLKAFDSEKSNLSAEPESQSDNEITILKSVSHNVPELDEHIAQVQTCIAQHVQPLDRISKCSNLEVNGKDSSAGHSMLEVSPESKSATIITGAGSDQSVSGYSCVENICSQISIFDSEKIDKFSLNDINGNAIILNGISALKELPIAHCEETKFDRTCNDSNTESLHGYYLSECKESSSIINAYADEHETITQGNNNEKGGNDVVKSSLFPYFENGSIDESINQKTNHEMDDASNVAKDQGSECHQLLSSNNPNSLLLEPATTVHMGFYQYFRTSSGLYIKKPGRTHPLDVCDDGHWSNKPWDSPSEATSTDNSSGLPGDKSSCDSNTADSVIPNGTDDSLPDWFKTSRTNPYRHLENLILESYMRKHIDNTSTSEAFAQTSGSNQLGHTSSTMSQSNVQEEFLTEDPRISPGGPNHSEGESDSGENQPNQSSKEEFLKILEVAIISKMRDFLVSMKEEEGMLTAVRQERPDLEPINFRPENQTPCRLKLSLFDESCDGCSICGEEDERYNTEPLIHQYLMDNYADSDDGLQENARAEVPNGADHSNEYINCVTRMMQNMELTHGKEIIAKANSLLSKSEYHDYPSTDSGYHQMDSHDVPNQSARPIRNPNALYSVTPMPSTLDLSTVQSSVHRNCEDISRINQPTFPNEIERTLYTIFEHSDTPSEP